MFQILNNINELNDIKCKEAFINIVGVSSTIHPSLNDISYIYLRPMNYDSGLIIPINHNDFTSYDIEDVKNHLIKYDILYTINKKENLHYLKLDNLWDIIVPSNINTSDDLIKPSIYDDVLYDNYVIPLVVQYGNNESLFKLIEPMCFKDESQYATFFNERVSLVFSYLEENSIKVDKDIFEDFFYKLDGDLIYSNYNLKNITTRPSNSFKGVNFSALSKKDSRRKSIIPNNDWLIEIDIKAYHPSLVAKIIGYEFPTDDIHQYFADLYGVDYNRAKELTFKQIYGNVFPQYEDLEFFKLLKVYIKDVWDSFLELGYHKCLISGYIYKKSDIKKPSPEKLFNYILQNLETSLNVIILWKIIKAMMGFNSKIILYVYDSILIDFDKNDKEVILKIDEILNSYKLNYRITKGKNYHELS